MKMLAKPARRDGPAKMLFERRIEPTDIRVTEDGSVALTIVARDIYTSKASQQYTIICDLEEMEMMATMKDCVARQ